VPALADALKEKPAYDSVRLHAAEALGRIGPAARDAVPALIAVLKLKDAANNPALFHALEALKQIGAKDRQAVALVTEALTDDNFFVRLYAARFVGRLDRDHKTVVTILMEGLRSASPAERRLAAEAAGE